MKNNYIVKENLGFHFTETEDKAIRKACKKALEFMKSYGKGVVLAPVDYSRYITNCKYGKLD